MSLTDRKLNKIENLLEIMQALRDPDTGCPWDVKQDFKSIARYTLEEAYEVVEAIELDDMNELRDELGDLLLQVVFHAQMAREKNLFAFEDVVQAICSKMISRHPHVFGSSEQRATKPEKGFWEDIKARERAEKSNSVARRNEGLLSSVAGTLPAITRAGKLQAKAARVGFDWPDIGGVFDKVEEELEELKQARADNSQEQVAQELGDLLFSVVNLARHLEVDAEAALRRANRKFESRFKHMESIAESPFEDLSGAQWERLWGAAKQRQA